MEMFSENNVKSILNKCGVSNVDRLDWYINAYSNNMVGYLGEHLSLIVEIESKGLKSQLKFFVKCVPRFDEWKANYLQETSFFKKEYVMLSQLFENFQNNNGLRMWRPTVFFIKENLFVFEDVTQMNYTMPSHLNTLYYDEVIATVAALARFHAQSFIYEEQRSKVLNRPYRIWEDYSNYLSEPIKSKSWRDTGMRAAIDILRVFSHFRSEPNFVEIIERNIPELFNHANNLMKPSTKYRNVVIHRDVWSNNIFLKKLANDKMHALIVDYQTVLYCPPVLDLSSMIYFNTTKRFRIENTTRIIDYYYEILDNELNVEKIDIRSIITKPKFVESYTESLVFALTQAALIVPIIAMTDEKRKEIFNDPDRCAKINVESRSQELIDLASENKKYRLRVTELLDDLVQTFCIRK